MADISQSILRKIKDLYNNPGAYLEMVGDQLANTTQGREAVINQQGAGYRSLSPNERRKRMIEGSIDTVAGPLGGALGVIKQRGGNWLTGAVEDALSGLKTGLIDGGQEMIRRGLITPEQVARRPDVALNKWIEGPLTKYVKRDMATPEDPVRALAEQGILHFDPTTQPPGVSGGIPSMRREVGFPMWGTAESNLAKRWEDLSDSAISPRTVGTQLKAEPPWNDEGMPWLRDMNPESYVYHTSRDMKPERLGFDHLSDELANALNPDSGLPRHLLLTPEKMQQMGMEKAVRHVDAINKWRAEEMAKANLARSQSPAVHTFKEYAENNPKGLRWVELRKPDDVGRRVDIEDVPDEMAQLDHTAVQEAVEDMAYDMGLDRGTPEFEAFVRGELTRTQAKNVDESIKLLRDQLKYEGDTMGHCVGGYCDDVASGKSRIFSLRDSKGEPHVTIETGRGTSELPPSEAEDLGERIVQIKGKQNKAPKDDYLPFVQDFVKSGKWSEVGDIQNARLQQVETTDGIQYLTPEEFEAAKTGLQKPEFANGGLVEATDYAYPGMF